jgi:hypothetical protein
MSLDERRGALVAQVLPQALLALGWLVLVDDRLDRLGRDVLARLDLGQDLLARGLGRRRCGQLVNRCRLEERGQIRHRVGFAEYQMGRHQTLCLALGRVELGQPAAELAVRQPGFDLGQQPANL